MIAWALWACTGATQAPPPEPAVQPVPPDAPEVLYFVFVDRFANGDPSNDGSVDPSELQAWHGGDLAGVRQRLDHLQGLGVTRVWLSPVFASRQQDFHGWGAFHGYWITDPTTVEPRFGTTEELRALSDDLHARGMKLDLDVVWNHVAWEAPVRAEHPEWFHPDTPITDWEDDTQRIEGWVHGLPDLAQEQPEVAAWLAETSLGWLEAVAPDGFRIDAVRHMPPAFIRAMGETLHAAAGSDFRLLGESFTGDPWLLAESRREAGLDAVFDFPLRYALVDAFCHGRSLGRVGAILSLDRYHDDPNTSLVTFLDNHDVKRVTHECGGDLDKVRAALDTQFALRGVPMISYGTEAALDGGEEPENRADLPWDQPHPLAEDLRRLTRRRAEHPALAEGNLTVLEASDDRLLLRRESRDEALNLAVTRSGVTLLPATGHPWVPDLREVIVTVRDAPPGATIALTGTGPDLGNWAPPEAHVAGPDGTVRFEAVLGDVLEYKLVATGGETVAWEPGDNRYTQVRYGDGPLALDLVWGSRDP